jgi:hypothetical protein
MDILYAGNSKNYEFQHYNLYQIIYTYVKDIRILTGILYSHIFRFTYSQSSICKMNQSRKGKHCRRL